ncbi:MAG: sensor histidine kinase [Litorimonas sp.]
MSDLRVRFGFILALALFPLLLSSVYMAFGQENVAIILVSALAWVFGYFAIWLTTDRLVFTHLRRIKITSDKFSRGDLDARVGNMRSAPQRVVELGNAFDQMAEKIGEREARLIDNLHEKEVLLREIHHRVKNNLQIIISLLNMQERKLSDPVSLSAIREIRGRINAIALVHRGLYEGKDLRVVDMPIFLNRLVGELRRGLGTVDEDITIAVNVEPIQLESDTAVPVALFVVEALTNALKHGVKPGGTINIELRKTEGGSYISVSDDGGGVSAASIEGTGAKLMRGFARQLSGKFDRQDTDVGHCAKITF